MKKFYLPTAIAMLMLTAAPTYALESNEHDEQVNDTLPDKSMIQLTNDGVDWAVGQTTATFHGYLLGLHYHEGATETGFVYATHPISDEAVTTLPEGVSKLKGNYIATRRVASGPFSATMTDVEDETVYFYRA